MRAAGERVTAEEAGGGGGVRAVETAVGAAGVGVGAATCVRFAAAFFGADAAAGGEETAAVAVAAVAAAMVAVVAVAGGAVAGGGSLSVFPSFAPSLTWLERETGGGGAGARGGGERE